MSHILTLQRHTERYELADGVRDLQTVLWLSVIGGLAYLTWDLPNVWRPFVNAASEQIGQTTVGIIIFVALFTLSAVINYGGLWLLNQTLRRWLRRESGWVKPRQPIIPRPMLYGILTVGMIGVAVGGWVAIQTNRFEWLYEAVFIASALEMALMYGITAARLDILRYWGVVAVGSIGTLLLWIAPLSVGMFALGMCAIWAGALLVSAVIGLRGAARLQQAVANA